MSKEAPLQATEQQFCGDECYYTVQYYKQYATALWNFGSAFARNNLVYLFFEAEIGVGHTLPISHNILSLTHQNKSLSRTVSTWYCVASQWHEMSVTQPTETTMARARSNHKAAIPRYWTTNLKKEHHYYCTVYCSISNSNGQAWVNPFVIPTFESDETKRNDDHRQTASAARRSPGQPGFVKKCPDLNAKGSCDVYTTRAQQHTVPLVLLLRSHAKALLIDG